ncbi:HupE/UreJ family protein [Mesorhizobium mediterraneum]|nr:HupE/UreJ family protein [Mesorhizobium mediterraneum]WIW53283.1 HupE/UreJ family protein [Mesorhizobium mediterraneum]
MKTFAGMKTLARLGTLSAMAALTPSLAFAHSGGLHVHGLFAGLEHPLLGMDHLLAMVAVGMIGARAGGRSIALVPLFFVSAMVAGALLGMAGIGLPSLETGIALSLVVFGAMIGLARPLPLAAAAALTALFGLFHGNAHGLEIPESAGGIAYAAGFVLGTSMLHAIGVLSVLTLARWPTTVRTAGVATSLVGMAMAVQAF